MKKPSVFLIISILAVACNSGGGDKKAQLAELKKQKSEIDAKIAALEKETGAKDTNADNRIKLVMTAAVQPQTFKHYVEVQGTIDARQNINVTP